MKQAINLLDDLPRWEKPRYPFALLIRLSILFFILLLAYLGLIHLAHYREKTHIKKLEVMKKDYTQQVEKLEKQANKLTEQSEALVTQYNAIHERLPAWKVQNSEAFSHILDALANTIPLNTWLVQFSIKDNDKHIDLYGNVYKTQQAVKFVTRLNKSSSFQDPTFKLSRINNVTDKHYVFFHITNNGQIQQGVGDD